MVIHELAMRCTELRGKAKKPSGAERNEEYN